MLHLPPRQHNTVIGAAVLIWRTGASPLCATETRIPTYLNTLAISGLVEPR